MPENLTLPRSIFGLHEPGGEFLMAEKGKPGWIVFTHELGRDPNHTAGYNHRPWSDRGFGIIARLNHGYGSAGTIPQPQHYDAFARRVRNFVQASPGCKIWIIGNEPNHAQERPDDQPITPKQYASCYQKCWEQIHSLPDHQDDQVAIAAVAPWNVTTTYPGNENGDWIKYFQDILSEIRNLGCAVDAIVLHTYTHGSDPNLVFSGQKVNLAFQNYHYHFRCYQDYMNAIPAELRHLPVYITEADQDDPWENVNRGWVQNAYREINDWNTQPGRQQIRALVLYRWPQVDQWYIESKTGVYEDFRAAANNNYAWQEAKPPYTINGHLVQGAFLDFYDKMGQGSVGLPISDEIQENGLKTQYFEQMVLQLDASGKVILKPVGVEILALRQTVRNQQGQMTNLQTQVKVLQDRMLDLQRPGSTGKGIEPTVEILQPAWESVVYQLTRHSSKQYTSRSLSAVQYVAISHSAVPGTVRAELIAQYHVKQLQWPGIGYHFYVDGDGALFKTNELATVCYHVGEYDPVAIGICVGGNFTATIPSEAQLASLAHLVAWLLQEFNLPTEAIKGKGELVETQSPGYQWLNGQVWKNILLAEVEKARTTKAGAYAAKCLYHYLLFGQNTPPWADANWPGTQEYIGHFGVTHGSLVDDARLARYVTILGNTSGIDSTAEQGLLAAGCRVERIAGMDPAETGSILERMALEGRRFLSLNGV